MSEGPGISADAVHAEYLRQLFAWTPTGMVVVSPADGRFLAVNPAFCRMVGYAEEELLERSFGDLTHPEDRAESQRRFREVVAAEALPRPLDKRYLHRDGHVVWGRVHMAPVPGEGGATVAMAATVEDVTEEHRRREQVERSQVLLRIAGEVAALGGWEYDFRSGEQTWSDEIFRIFEVEGTDEPPPVEQVIERYLEPHRERLMAAMETASSRAVPFDLELEVETFQGRRRWVRAVGEPVRGSDGEVVRLIGAFQDVTDLRTATHEAALMGERLIAVLESMTDAIFTVDREWRFTYLNSRAARLLQRERRELLGRVVWEEFPEAVDTAFSETYQRVMETGQPEAIPEVYYEPLDTWFTVNAFRSDEGVAVYFRDITQEREARLAIEQRAALVEEAQDAITVRDLRGIVQLWNPAAERVFGWRADEAVGRSIAELLTVDAEAERAIERVLLEEGRWTGELRVHHRDGSELTVERRMTLLMDDDGRPRSVMAMDTDVSEHRRLEQQLLRAQRMESIGTLASGIAHDLNNVLAPVVMATDLLSYQDLTEEQQELLETIAVSARRGADMVRQVLTFARGVDTERGEFTPRTLVEDLQRIVRDTFPKNIELRIELPDDPWDLHGDTVQLQQVLLNLAVNARDAMPEGGTLRIEVDNVDLDETYAAMNPDAEPGAFVRFTMADDGVGMPPEVRERLFEPFFTTKSAGDGTGLGLPTSQAIVRSHRGFMTVYSEPGRGTTFRVYLPASSAGVRAAPSTSAGELPRGQGELILVVEDEASVRTITQQTLEAFGYRVRTAGDGAAAISLFSRHQGDIDLVLTDLMMPVMDGTAAIRALRRIDPQVQVLATSGLSERGRSQLDLDDADGFIAKPYTAETLLREVAAMLGRDA